MKKLSVFLCVMFLVFVRVGDVGAIIIGVDFTGGAITSLQDPPRTNGFQFTITEERIIPALGIWDEGGDSLLNQHTITLWDTTQTVLASTIVDNTGFSISSINTGGSWTFMNISPLLLNVGTYILGAGYEFLNDDKVRFDESQITLSTAPFFSYVENRFTSGGQEGIATFPPHTNSNIIFGPNLLFEETSAPIPVPSTFILMGTGLLGLAGIGVRRRSRR